MDHEQAMSLEQEVQLFHRVLAVMEEGELVNIQARLPEDRDDLLKLWRSQPRDEPQPAAAPTLGWRMKELYDTRTALKREPFCEVMGMKPQNWQSLTNDRHKTTKRDYIWRFAVLLRLNQWETLDLLRLDNELDMKRWDERDRTVLSCLKEEDCTPDSVEAALREKRLSPLYSPEAWELMNHPRRWAEAQNRKKMDSMTRKGGDVRDMGGNDRTGAAGTDRVGPHPGQ